MFERDAAVFTRALAHATADNATSSTSTSRATPKGWTLDRIAPLEKAILRTALLEMLHPDLVEGDRPIPAEGAIDEAVETAKAFCGADAPGFVNGILGAVLREVRQNGGAHADPTDSTMLVERLERTAAELRAGDLDPRARRALVDDCARAGRRGGRRARPPRRAADRHGARGSSAQSRAAGP